MRTILTLLILCCYSSTFAQNIEGNWEGGIDVNGSSIPIVFHFFKDSSGQMTGKWDSPSQNALNLPMTEVSLRSDSIFVHIKMISGSYTGKFLSADSISGTWQQGNNRLPLDFSRITAEAAKKKQAQSLPNEDEREISIVTKDGLAISGTLLSKNNNDPVVIIIAGSGPTDRNGNNPQGVASNSYKLLANELVEDNIATYRYDKRGISKNVKEGMKESDLSFDGYIADAVSIFDYLHDSLHFKRIFFAGHSEGSLIGMIAAQRRPVAGFISISGAGRPLDVILEEQLSSSPAMQQQGKLIDSIFLSLKNGRTVDSIPESLRFLFRPSVQPYLISWLKYNPVQEIKKTQVPVLILQGVCDKQVKVADAQQLHKAMPASTLEIIPHMTHTLKNAGNDCNDENFATYTDATLPLNKQLVKDIVEFVKK